MRKSAILSEDGKYRYLLERWWGPSRGVVGTFVMLNPSTADADIDDPTIRRCIEFAKSWGWSGICVRNLFAGRATKPEELFKMRNPVGPQNDQYLGGALFRTSKDVAPVVCAWGANPKARTAAERFIKRAQAMGHPLYCLGTTKTGAPKHPLYLKGDTKLAPFAAD